MYFLNPDLAQWPGERNLPLPSIIWGGRGKSVTEDELIDQEIKRGASVDNLTDKVFQDRYPELWGCRLPRSCQELQRLQREWRLIHAKIAMRKARGEVKNVPKAR